MNFKRENVNPKEIQTNDCVIRALSKANNMSWESTYLILCEIGMKKCRMPNDKYVYEQFLKDHGWEKYKMPKRSNGKKYMIKDFVESLPPYHKSKKIIISVPRHLTFVDNGTLIDSWNCERRYVGNYWIKF